jgi:dTDP-4-dehydrorhamnose reductase
MRVLITGAAGQLGQALLAHRSKMFADHSLEVLATSRHGGDGLQALDLADPAACRSIVEQWKPDWLINAGAYTAVDQAELEPDLAYAVNAAAPAAFAEALQEVGGRLLQISTDFVFNGEQGFPYRPDQPTNPLGVYGSSKAAGEEAVFKAMGSDPSAVILRTSWVYGPVGRNFLLTMLRLHREKADQGAPLCVVADQVGCPTATAGLAIACWHLVSTFGEKHPLMSHILHWSDAGAASWYDFAVAIGDLGQQIGLLKKAASVVPITTQDYPTRAKRPSYSLLDCRSSRQLIGLHAQHWHHALFDVMHELLTGSAA